MPWDGLVEVRRFHKTPGLLARKSLPGDSDRLRSAIEKSHTEKVSHVAKSRGEAEASPAQVAQSVAVHEEIGDVRVSMGHTLIRSLP